MKQASSERRATALDELRSGRRTRVMRSSAAYVMTLLLSRPRTRRRRPRSRIAIKLGATYLLIALLFGFLGLFVWGWYASERDIPELVFAALSGLVGTLVGYLWMKDKKGF